jgi:hypothetical protein
MPEILRWLSAIEADTALREYYAEARFFDTVISTKEAQCARY